MPSEARCLSPQPPHMPQKDASRRQRKPQLLIVTGDLQAGQQAEGSSPWGNLQPGGQVDWSICPKAASLAAADKPSSRSTSPAPSSVSARSLPNLQAPEAGPDPKAPSQDGQSSPRGDPLAGMSSVEIQRHMARQAIIAAREEAGTLSDKSSASHNSHDSPIGSLADSPAGGLGLGDKAASQAASEPSLEEADQVSRPPLVAKVVGGLKSLSRTLSGHHWLRASTKDWSALFESCLCPVDAWERLHISMSGCPCVCSPCCCAALLRHG